MNSKFPVLTTGTYDPAGVGGLVTLFPMIQGFSQSKLICLFCLIFVFLLNSLLKKILRF